MTDKLLLPARGYVRTLKDDEAMQPAKHWARDRTEIRAFEQRRRRYIDRWAAKGPDDRGWIGFIELAEWAARSVMPSNTKAEREATNLAYWLLCRSMVRGEFERDGRSVVLYLDPPIPGDSLRGHGLRPRNRLSADQLKIALEASAPNLPDYTLVRCWLPRRVADRWLRSHAYPPLPMSEARSAWEPGNKKLEEWAVLPAAEAAARRLASSPSEVKISEALARMWSEAGRDAVKPDTIRRYRRTFRAGQQADKKRI